MKTFTLRILEADEDFYEGPCLSLSAPLLDGQYGILAGHNNMAAAIVPGALRFQRPGEEMETVAVAHGLLKVENNNVLVLVEAVERLDEIDTVRAQLHADQARRQLQQKGSRREYELAQAALSRNLNRLMIKKGTVK